MTGAPIRTYEDLQLPVFSMKYNRPVINGHNLLQLRYEQTYKYDVLHSEKALLALDLNILTVDRMHHCTPLQSAIIAFCI